MDSDTNNNYVRGFNHAYLLTEHKLELLNKLLISASSDDYFLGMKDGKRIFEKELSRKSRLKELNNLSMKKDIDQDQEI